MVKSSRQKHILLQCDFKDGDEIFSFLLPEKGEMAWQVREIQVADGRAFVANVGKRQDLVMITAINNPSGYG